MTDRPIPIRRATSSIQFGVCYRSPSAQEEENNCLFECVGRHSGKVAVIMGDFNYGDIDWSTMKANGEGEKFIKMVHDYFLT